MLSRSMHFIALAAPTHSDATLYTPPLPAPSFCLYSEVFKALNKTRGLYLRWRELGENGGAEVEWTTTELRNSLRSIEWDLEDLEDTINILLLTNQPTTATNHNSIHICCHCQSLTV